MTGVWVRMTGVRVRVTGVWVRVWVRMTRVRRFPYLKPTYVVPVGKVLSIDPNVDRGCVEGETRVGIGGGVPSRHWSSGYAPSSPSPSRTCAAPTIT